MSFDWHVSITVCKTWKGSRHLYAIAYAVMNGMENLRFDKEGYFHVLVFYTSYFIKEIENIFSRVPIRCRRTRNCVKHSPYGSCSHFNLYVILDMLFICYSAHSPYFQSTPLSKWPITSST